MGFTDDDLDADLEVLAANLPAVHVFLAMQTQWRSGMAGPTGLDYAALPAVYEGLGIMNKARRLIFAGVRVIESETLRVFAEKRESDGRKR